MIRRLAVGMSCFCVANNIVAKEDEEVYEYGFELLFSTLANAVAVLVLSMVTGNTVASAFFFIGFLPLRAGAGGFHAKNHFRCFLILMLTYIVFIGIITLLPLQWYLPVTGVSIVSSTALVFMLSPMEHENKPLSKERVETLRTRSRINVSACVFIAALLYLTLPNKQYVLSFALGVLTVGLSLLASMIKKMSFSFSFSSDCDEMSETRSNCKK